MKTRYDIQEDILSSCFIGAVAESIESDDFIIDVGKEGKVVGVEVLNASANLGMTKGELSSVDSMEVERRSARLVIKLANKDIFIPISAEPLTAP